MYKYYLFKFIRIIFPKKIIESKNFALKLIALISIIGIVICSVWLGLLEYKHIVLKRDNNKIQDIMAEILEQRAPDSEVYDFDLLHKQNADIKAWIRIPGTDIDYPICQTNDNDYYLKHNFNKKYSAFGTLFFDFQNEIDSSQNITVYGHSVKNGQMFTSIRQYANLDFYKQHPTIQLLTPNGLVEYKIFTAMVMNADPKDDNGYLYPYTKTDFDTQRDFINWIEEAFERSIIQTSVDILPNDRIITLSTCGYEFKNQRFVVMARQVRDGESREVDVESSNLNPNPRYPKKWYDTKKIIYPW